MDVYDPCDFDLTLTVGSAEVFFVNEKG